MKAKGQEPERDEAKAAEQTSRNQFHEDMRCSMADASALRDKRTRFSGRRLHQVSGNSDD